MKPVYFLLVIFLLTIVSGCKNLPPFENLSSDFVVFTKYDQSVNFTNYKTFAVKDYIQVITGDPKDTIWDDANAQSIINEVISQMTKAGYTQVPIHSNPDLGINLIGIRNTTIYAIPPGYWWGYPGWGSPCYWGYCGGWGYWYPYYYTVSVSTGTIIVEMADLKNAASSEKINIIWSDVGNGQVGTSTSFIVDQCIKTVDQGFAQSPYLKAQ
ncbi:MAG TPA: DUF4136 domain-containing protein [Puia sp.]|nr:DUF4136 domain-containing protein [Puia sp.]